MGFLVVRLAEVLGLKQPMFQIFVIQVPPLSSILASFLILLHQLLPPFSVGTSTVFGGGSGI